MNAMYFWGTRSFCSFRHFLFLINRDSGK
jgi:hypothetical protein